MKALTTFVFSVVFSYCYALPPSFIDNQLKYSTVAEAKALVDLKLKTEFEKRNLNYPPHDMLLQVFKSEAVLEVWVQNEEGDEFELFKSYNICGMSGTVGPKRRRGDQQVPEGLYHISYYNPESSFFLSMKVDYPNAADSILGNVADLGDNIFMHGSCCSLGCIAITDDFIAEVYWMAVQVKNNTNGKLPVYIYPARMTEFKTNLLTSLNGGIQSAFWKNMKQCYDQFNRTKKRLNYTVNERGEYVFN